MNSLPRGPDELKIGSSILSRQGGTDANAPESLRKAILGEIGMLAFWRPNVWKLLETYFKNKSNKYEHAFLRDQDGPK